MGRRVRTVVTCGFAFLAGPLLLWLSAWLERTAVFGGAPRERLLTLTDGYFLSSFLFLGLVAFVIFLLARCRFPGKTRLVLVLPCFYLFFFSLPGGTLTQLPDGLIDLWADLYGGNGTLAGILFFTYLIIFFSAFRRKK